MLSKLKKVRDQKSEQGFTIIEVMIVLAIAGLIILVVLLAVPALQRNGRNTAIKNDASALAGGVSEFASNNDGAMPLKAQSTVAGGTITLNSSTTGTPSTVKVQGSTIVTLFDAPAAATPDAGAVMVYFKSKCPASVTGATVTPVASGRGTAIVYAIETAGANAAKCLDS